MAGIELLRERLAELGLNKSAIHSKSVELTVAVIANGDDVDAAIAFKELLDQYYVSSNALIRERTKVNNELKKLSLREERKSNIEKRLSESSRILEEQRIQLSQMIYEFKNCLSECETAEGRDAARKVAFYIANTKVNTPYDNTAFIYGLAALLSDVQSDLPDNIKKTIANSEEAVSSANSIINNSIRRI